MKQERAAAPRAVSLCLVLIAASLPATAERASSIYWSDADSGRIDGEKFRIHNFDAPETGPVGARSGARCEAERAHGFEAKAAAIALTRHATLEVTGEYGRDTYGRRVIDLRVDGADYARAMQADGWLKLWNFDAGESKPDWCKDG